MQRIENLKIRMLERGIAFLDRVARRRGRREELAPHLETGERGELAAYFYLRRLGFLVVARRWNDGPLPGDLDIVAWQGEVLCFVEVKTRGSRLGATASSAVDGNKQKILRRLARQYLRQVPDGQRVETRFDIVTVYEKPDGPPDIQLIPGAFGWRSDEF